MSAAANLAGSSLSGFPDARHLGAFTDYPSLVALLRARKDHLGLSNAAVEEMGGFAAGQVDKMLGPSMSKSLGRLTLPIIMDILCVSGILFVDDAKIERMAVLMADESRNAGCVRERHRPGKVAIRRVMRELASNGGRARAASLTAHERSKIAREGAKARWKA